MIAVVVVVVVVSPRERASSGGARSLLSLSRCVADDRAPAKRRAGGGGRNEKPAAGGAGQSVGQPVGRSLALSFLALSALSARLDSTAYPYYSRFASRTHRNHVPSFLRSFRDDECVQIERGREREGEGESVSDRVQFSLASAHIQVDIQGDARA